MSVNINADTTNGLVLTSDTSGELKLQSAGADIATVNSSGITMAAGKNLYPKVPAFSARIGTSQIVTTSTYTKLQFDTVDFDTSSDYDNVTNYRYTPSVAGYYQFNYQCFVNHNATNQYNYLMLRKNGIEVKFIVQIDTNAKNKTLQGSSILYANGSTDYFELYGYHTFGSDLTFYSNTNANQFQAFLVSTT